MRRCIEAMGHDELERLSQDLGMKDGIVKSMVDRRLLEAHASAGRICSGCMGDMDPISINNYTIIFGPHDLRKKASFCGTDCLSHFIHQLKEMRNNAPVPENRER